jgi:hypothetical protein
MGVKTISGIFLISILLIAGGCQVGGRQGVEDPPPYDVYFMEGVYSQVFKGFDPGFPNAVIKLWYVHGEEVAPIVLRNYPGRHAVLDPGGKGAGAIICGSSYIRIEGLEIRSNMVYGTTGAGGDFTPAPLYADKGALTGGYSVNMEKVYYYIYGI